MRLLRAAPRRRPSRLDSHPSRPARLRVFYTRPDTFDPPFTRVPIRF
ncbi:hypothetical protein F01_260086 [Burkholderia cenocepacia]|nr:hypothetical protein F01_260086 [Burkholderia cenocepacia]